MGQEKPQVNCLKCKYFAITWDTPFPRACKLFGFKGRAFPSATVLQSTGEPCQGFEPKEQKG